MSGFLDEDDGGMPEVEYDEYGQPIEDGVRRFVDYDEQDFEPSPADQEDGDPPPGFVSPTELAAALSMTYEDFAAAMRRARWRNAKARYAAYLQSPYWLVRRARARRRAGYRCERCEAVGVRLDVHHRSYEHLGAEPDEDLEVLCGRCHAADHGKPLRSRVRL